MSTATRPKPNALRAENAHLRAELAKYVGQDPTAAEEMAHLASENERLDAAVQTLAGRLASVSEHLFLTGGTGEVDRFLAKRNGLTDQWAVYDGTLLSARYWGRDYAWHPTSGGVTVAEMFPWSEDEACRYASMLAGWAVMPGDELPPSTLAPADEALVEAHLAEVGSALDAMVAKACPPEEVEARLASTIATVIARHAKPMTVPEAIDAVEELTRQFFGDEMTLTEAQAAARKAEADVALLAAAPLDAEADPETTLTVPAPADLPDFQPEPPDPAEADTILTPLAASISVNAEQATVALPKARVNGPAETQQMAVIHVDAIPPEAAPATLPPLPDRPPVFMSMPPVTWRGGQLRPLSDAVPVQFVKTGARP